MGVGRGAEATPNQAHACCAPLSQGMLREAGELKAQRQLGHVELLQMDAG